MRVSTHEGFPIIGLFEILAFHTFAVLRAQDSSLITFAISFQTERSFARTAFVVPPTCSLLNLWSEGIRITLQYTIDCFLANHILHLIIAAISAIAIAVAVDTRSKAFAV